MTLDRPTMEERYTRAVNATSLVLKERTQSACDILIAAGKSDPLAISLYRLSVEFDEARSDARLAWRNDEHTRRAAKDAGKRGAKKAQGELIAQAEANATMARAFVMLRLKSLASTKQQFGEWVDRWATERRFLHLGSVPLDLAGLKAWRERYAARQAIIGKLAGRVLDVLLDPLCPPCEGRAFTGGYDGKAVLVCRQCKGTPGRRTTDDLGNSPEQNAFCEFLLSKCERMLSEVEQEMKALLRV